MSSRSFFISQASRVEVIATICRKACDQSMPIIDRDKLINDFRKDCKRIYSTEQVTNAIYAAAGGLCRTHRLRAYDAVQLACAININKKVLVYQTSLPIFICADKKLIEFACAEGLPTDNPNDHL
jgi:predicted nucleic acid-binding protein